MRLWKASGGSTGAYEAGVACAHTFEEHMEPIHGLRYNGRDRVLTFGDREDWKMWKFTQDMHPLDLKTKLLC
jgi:hypothetical protein